MAQCTSCKSRKGKRNCPALSGLLCSQCCGAKKGAEIQCPSGCSYADKSKKYFDDKHRVDKDFVHDTVCYADDEDRCGEIMFVIDYAIKEIHEEHEDLMDKDVQMALEYLLEKGKADLEYSAKVLQTLSPNARLVVDAVNNALELDWLSEDWKDLLIKLKCINRVLDAVKMYVNSCDARNYLNYLSEALPE
jgi:hypothetical protein